MKVERRIVTAESDNEKQSFCEGERGRNKVVVEANLEATLHQFQHALGVQTLIKLSNTHKNSM